MAKGHAILGQILVTQPEGRSQRLLRTGKPSNYSKRLTTSTPSYPTRLFELALFLGDLSSLEQMAGKLDSALGSGNKAVEILERLEQQHPGILEYEQSLAGAYNITSDLHRYRREPAEAIAFAQKAKTLLERLSTRHRDDASLRIDLAKSQNILVECSSKQESRWRHSDHFNAPLIFMRAYRARCARLLQPCM